MIAFITVSVATGISSTIKVSTIVIIINIIIKVGIAIASIVSRFL